MSQDYRQELRKALLESSFEMSSKLLLEEGSIMPVWIILYDDGTAPFIRPTPWRNEAEKVAALGAMRSFIKLTGAVMYAMISETWMAHRTASSFEEAEKQGPRPSQDPNRLEALMIVIADPVGGGEFFSWEMLRDKEGKLTGFKPLKTPSKEHSQGRMLNLFA
jgi:hypothetical protein